MAHMWQARTVTPKETLISGEDWWTHAPGSAPGGAPLRCVPHASQVAEAQ